MSESRIRRNDRTTFRKMEEGSGGVLLHLDSGEYRQLNETGALIWSLLEPQPSRQELVDALRGQILDPPPQLEEEVDAFLAALRDRNLIDWEPAADEGA
jgi:hypothetical protein